MYKFFLLSILFCILLSCTQLDDSGLIADDNGVLHRTIHYLKDQRGRNYFPKKIPATGSKQFIFDPQAYAWAAYDANGQRIMTGAASGGQDFCQDVGQPCRTVPGIFRIYNKKDINCRSGEFPVETVGGAKMPYCMYFYRGYTIHAAFEVPNRNSSHGCVRVFPSAAKWLNEEFMVLGTKVIILPYADYQHPL